LAESFCIRMILPHEIRAQPQYAPFEVIRMQMQAIEIGRVTGVRA
jgi:hypothetical protein